MIEFKNVNFAYHQGHSMNSLVDLNLSIKAGEVVLLCGESGCGKTTLTRLINGLVPHYYEGLLSGRAEIYGKSIIDSPLFETAKIVGSVFQNPRSQFFNVDTTSEIAFGCENMGLPVDVIKQRLIDTEKSLKLENLMGRNIFHLSGGEKQKIACASVSASCPEIFVLDEPSSNLDMMAIKDLREVIRHWKACGKTVVIAEHRLHYLRDLADRVLFMSGGRVEKEYLMKEMLNLSAGDLAKMGLRPLKLNDSKSTRMDSGESNQRITLKHFKRAYGKKDALCIESLEVPKGSVIAVIGHNGAGKSTFARCLCGLENKCKGVLEEGNLIINKKHRLKKSYMVMQDVNHQLFTESVMEEVLLSMDPPDRQLAESILKGLNLDHLREFHPMSLSGGEKQRVAIASAVACKKDLIIFDEPTSGLDLRHMHEVCQQIKKLEKQGRTLFIITHDLELIMECCKHVIHLSQGRVINQYPLDDEGLIRLKAFFLDSEI